VLVEGDEMGNVDVAVVLLREHILPYLVAIYTSASRTIVMSLVPAHRYMKTLSRWNSRMKSTSSCCVCRTVSCPPFDARSSPKRLKVYTDCLSIFPEFVVRLNAGDDEVVLKGLDALRFPDSRACEDAFLRDAPG
jgi:hypothetical protein